MKITIISLTIIAGLIVGSTIQAMEKVEPEVTPHIKAIITELTKTVKRKDFAQYFVLIQREPLEVQKQLCNLPLETKSNKKAVHFAAKQGNTDALKKLLELGAHVNDRDSYGNTPLLCAVEKGHLNSMNFLLEKGAHKLAQDNANRNVLSLAIKGDYAAIMLTLIKDHGLDIQGNTSFRPLHYAAELGHLKPLQMVIENGAHKDAVTPFGATALHIAALHGKTAAIRFLIQEHQFDPNAQNIAGETPLHYAVRSGMYEAVQVLIQNGARVEALDNYGQTLLHKAAMTNRSSLIAMLIKDHHLDPNVRDDTGLTPTGSAIVNRSCLAEYTLRCAGAQPFDGKKPKNYLDCCLSGLKTASDKTVQLQALAQGSLEPWDPNVTDTLGQTALMKAAKKGCLDCIRILLKDKRTDPNVQDASQKTALHHAIENGLESTQPYKICWLFLNKRRTKAALRDNTGKTPKQTLHEIVEKADVPGRVNKMLEAFAQVSQLFDLRKMRVQLYLSLKKRRCSKDCNEEVCAHIGQQLPNDICEKIVQLINLGSLPQK